MKKTIINTILIASVTPFLVHCAPQKDVDELRYQLRIVNKKIDDMKTTTVGQLQKRQAAAYGQMDQLEKDILELRSQLEESYHLNQRLREQNKELENSINAVAVEEASKREEVLKQIEQSQQEKEERLAALNEKLRLQEENLKAIQDARLKEAERKAKEAALAAELAKQRTSLAAASSGGSVQHITQDKTKLKKSIVEPQAAQSARSPEPASSQATAAPASQQVEAAPEPVKAPASGYGSAPKDDEMDKAKNLFENQKYNDAFALFEKVAGGSSGDAIDARYMMGECLFNEKEYDKAIMQYQKIISQYPDHNKAPSAMLKQAMAFEKLADKETAKVIYKKLLKKHGSSPEAATAQSNLSKL